MISFGGDQPQGGIHITLTGILPPRWLRQGDGRKGGVSALGAYRPHKGKRPKAPQEGPLEASYTHTHTHTLSRRRGRKPATAYRAPSGSEAPNLNEAPNPVYASKKDKAPGAFGFQVPPLNREPFQEPFSMWDFPKIGGTLSWGPYNKDPTT